MTETKNNITIADVLNSVLSYWYVIIISVVLFGGCFFLYFDNAKQTYKSSSILFLDFEKSNTTPFGEYVPGNLNSRDYLKLLRDENNINQTIEEFDLSISLEAFDNLLLITHPDYEKSKSVKLEMTLPNENVDKILSFHINRFIENLRDYHQREAINHFKAQFRSDIQLLERKKQYLERIIPIKDSVLRNMTPSNFSVAQLNKLKKQGFQVSIYEFFSPEYRFLSKGLVDLKDSVLKVESEIERINKLESELLIIEEQMLTGENKSVDLFSSQNYVNIFAASDKAVNVSKSVFKYTLLGVFVGLIFALFILLLIVIKSKNKFE